MEFTGYSDADWAGDIDDRKSTSGYIFQMVGQQLAGGARNKVVWHCQQLKPNIWRWRVQHRKQFGCDNFETI